MHIFTLIFLLGVSSMSSAHPLMIAHAAGGINGQNYSNSLEALNLSYQKGFRIFEMDFSWTSDGRLVCLHDWGKRFKKVFGHKIKHALSYAQFEQLLDKTKGLHPCTLETLAKWLFHHRDVKIITDIKYDNIKAIKKIVNHYPDMVKQLIPQFYQPQEYQVLKGMGFENLIWILYQYKGSLKSVLSIAQNMDLMAVSMRASQAKNKAMQQLNKEGVNLFVYTINKEKKVKKLTQKFNVSGIYTDFLGAKLN